MIRNAINPRTSQAWSMSYAYHSYWSRGWADGLVVSYSIRYILPRSFNSPHAVAPANSDPRKWIQWYYSKPATVLRFLALGLEISTSLGGFGMEGLCGRHLGLPYYLTRTNMAPLPLDRLPVVVQRTTRTVKARSCGIMKLKPYLYNRSVSWGLNRQQSERRSRSVSSYSLLWFVGIVWSRWDSGPIERLRGEYGILVSGVVQSRYGQSQLSSQSRRKWK